MSFGKGFSLGFRSFFKAFQIVFSDWRLGIFLLVPLALNILIIWGGGYAFDSIADYIRNWLLSVLGLNDASAGFLAQSISFVITYLFRFIFFLTFMYVGGYIVLAVMSPAMAFVSEMTEKKISGKDYPFSGEQWMRDMIRGILIVFRNLFIETGIIILVFIVGFIPVIGQIVSLFGFIFLFIVSSYFYGFSFLDYCMERRKMNVRDSVKFIRKNKGLAISTGGIFTFCLMIPFCGAVVGTFTSIFSTVGASIAMIEYEKQNNVKDQNI
jgi:CysZ protein